MHKRFGLMLIVYVALFTYSLPTKANGEIKKEPKLTLKWGTADGKVGFKKRSKTSIDEGPKSFFVASEDDIYILDNVNNRISRYIHEKWVSSIKLLSSVGPVDITVKKGILYVLKNFSIESYNENGKLIKIKKLSDEPSKIFSGVWRIFKSSDGLIVTTTKPGTILCLNDDLNYTTCDNWEEIFRKYTVYDVVNDMFFVDGGDKILYVDRSGKILSSTPDIFWDKPPTLFPVACWRRIINADTVYVMETKKTGITITKITQK